MAEVATGVLHNVGNVLNSVNVSCTLLIEQISQSRAENVSKVADLLAEQEDDLAVFFGENPRGRQVPAYLASLAAALKEERRAMLYESESLRERIDHIKEVVSMQQSYGRVSGVKETLRPALLMEDALKLNVDALARHGIEIVKQYEMVPSITVDKNKVLQILLNLIANAKYACMENLGEKTVTLRILSNGADRIRMQVSDNGKGIPPENLDRIFQHGFTTRKSGHGFGLHSGALAARDLDGSLNAYSQGPGLGATFTLELPCQTGHI
jgi:signal transduction histidine kinase